MERPGILSIACMILLLGMIFLMAGGCASQQSKLFKKKQQDVLKSYRCQVSVIIEDPERARHLIALGEEFYQQMRVDTKVLQKMFVNLDTLNKAYNTRREELESAFQAMNNHRRTMRENILVARVRALSLTTPEEWQELMGRRRTLLDLIRETPGLL